MTDKVQLHDDRAAYDLLAAVIKQARKDLVRGAVKIENRESAYLLFNTILEVRGATTDTRGAGAGHENRADIQSTNRPMFRGAGASRGGTA